MASITYRKGELVFQLKFQKSWVAGWWKTRHHCESCRSETRRAIKIAKELRDELKERYG